MIGRIRHTPFWGATSLFSKEVLKKILDEQRDVDRHSAIAIAVRKGQPQSSTPKNVHKREASAPVTTNTPQRKKFKGPVKGQVKIAANASDRVSRRKVRFLTRASIPHGGTPTHNDAASIRGKKSSRTSISKGGVTTRAVVRYSNHRPIRQVAHETILVGRDSSSTERKRQQRMGTSHRPVSPSVRVVDRPVALAGRCTVPGPIPPRVFTDASTKGLGVAFQESMWSGTWQRHERHIY